MTKRNFKNLTWYSFQEPFDNDLKYLKKKFKFHQLDLDDCLSENERPKIDEYDEYLFIILHFPVFIKKSKRVATSELRIFIGQNFLVTLDEGDLSPLQKLLEKVKKTKEKENIMGQGSGYLLYEIIKECYDYCLPIIDKDSRQIRNIEKDLFIDDPDNNILKEILIVKRNTINLSRILMPQSNILVNLEIKNKKFLPENLEIYFDDVKDTADKIRDTLLLNKETIATLQDTHESLISDRTNKIMKILTVFSVIMLPLTFLTGIWGMNIDLPFQENPLAFWAISLIMITLMSIMLIFFKIKKWL